MMITIADATRRTPSGTPRPIPILLDSDKPWLDVEFGVEVDEDGDAVPGLVPAANVEVVVEFVSVEDVFAKL